MIGPAYPEGPTGTNPIALANATAAAGDAATLATATAARIAGDAATLASANATAAAGDTLTLASANTALAAGDAATLASANASSAAGDVATLASANATSSAGDAATLASANGSAGMTTRKLVQGTWFDVPSVTADPAGNPAAGMVRVFFRSDTAQLCEMDSTGTIKRSAAFT